MLIADLLEELQRHKEENIIFHLMNDDEVSSQRVDVAYFDGRFILKSKDKDGNNTNDVILILYDPKKHLDPNAKAD